MTRERGIALGILAAALVLRLVHVLTIRDYPLFEVLSLDSESYDTWARRIAAGEWSRGAPFYQAPLYAYFLAALHGLSGGDLLFPRLVNALLGTVNVALVLAMGRRLFGVWPGLVAAALVALHGTFLFEEGKVMKTTLGVVLASGTLALLVEARVRSSTRLLFLAGVVGGLAALVRENFALFVAALVAFLLVRPPRVASAVSAASAAPAPIRARLRPAGALAAGAALAIAPATLHNFSYERELLPITAQAGQNFYTGIWPGNDHGGYLVPDFVRRSPRFEEIDFAAEASRRLAAEAPPGQISRYWLGEGLRVAAADPGRTARLFVTKLGLLFHDFEIPDDEDIRFFRRFAPVLRLPLPGFGLIAVLGIAGLVLAFGRRTLPPELGLFLAVYPLSVALFFVFSRYRLPLVAPLALLGGYAAVEAVRAWREGSRRPVVLAALACLPLVALVTRPLGAGTLANSHLSAGIGYEIAGQPGAALREYEAGLALEPDDPKLLRRAAKLAWDAAVGSGRGGSDDALFALVERAAAANPDDSSLLARHAAALASRGRVTEAAARFEEVLEAGEEPPGIHVNLALVYEALGRREEALLHAVRALERAPDDPFVRSLHDRLVP